MANHWDLELELPSALAYLAFHLEVWNRDVFGKAAMHQPIQIFVEIRYGAKELDLILDHIHVLWVQKARTDVLKDEDLNTKFFHACAMVSRKRNKIKGLFDDHGGWHDDLAEL
ncbi:LOW QUALITY PROTEIN: hypothetical protein V2J09_000229 [Rumex salicifolius]